MAKAMEDRTVSPIVLRAMLVVYAYLISSVPGYTTLGLK